MQKFDFLNEANIGKDYNGFALVSIDDLPDYKTKAVYLRHKTTGLEVYHILKDDKENLYAFAFRTVEKNSKGMAHIMEHSVLCGSEKFPLKEPFTTLSFQSLNTYLNACTYPDKTVYPGASVVRNDYFNMMDVYADCVFFPKLDYETFLQEGHRLELDENDKLSIQGVVYNEMKASYSSFVSVAYDKLIASMYPESYPAFDSGGDPLEIPTLTYEEFLDFHKRYYAPDNCILFLYGNIPTEEQLDFLNEKLMDRLEKKYGCSETVPYINQKTPYMKPEVAEARKLKLNTGSKTFETIGPETGATGNLAVMSWYTGKSDMEKYYLSEILCGNDSAPFSKALQEAELGDDEVRGNFNQYEEEFWVLGSVGLKEGDEKKLFKLIDKTVEKVYKKGISQEDIDSAVMGIDFNLREENRYYGPYSMQIMSKALKAWSFGKEIKSELMPITAFEKIKKQLAEDKDYTKKLIKKYFIDNKEVYKIIIRPSAEYYKNRKLGEEALIEKLSANIQKDKLKEELNKLHEYQQRIETPEELACIPHTKINELDKELVIATVDLDFVKGADRSNIPYFVSKENTNGIFYFDILFPFDRLDPSYYQYTPFLSNVMTNLGWNNKSWDECITEAGGIVGDVWGRLLVGNVSDIPQCKAFAEKYKEYNFMGRNWLGVSGKALASQAEETFKLCTEIITKMDFADKKRFKSLLMELKAEKKSELVDNGREYALRRATSSWSSGYAMAEILWGVSQLYTVDEYKEDKISEILKTFEFIYRESLKSGAILHVTADEESLKKIRPILERFAVETGLTKLLPANEYTYEDYLSQVRFAENQKENISAETIKIETQTGYAAQIIPGSPYLTKEASADLVYANWLSGHVFWDKFRTTGGCYGASIYPDSSEKLIRMSTYRDPAPEKTIELFNEVLEESAKIDISEDEIEKCIVSEYGSAITPFSPRDRGNGSFESFIYGNYGFKKQRVDNLLSVTAEDVKAAALRMAEKSKTVCHKAIFCDNSVDNYGKKLDLPL